MAELSRLKKFMICTFIVATLSFIVMFYYSMSISKYTALGVKYVTALKNGNLSRDLHGKALLSNNSVESPNQGTSSSAEEDMDHINSMLPSLRLNHTKEESIQENNNVQKNASNSSNKEPTVEPTKRQIEQSTSTVRVASFTPSSDTNSEVNAPELSLCPEKSPSLVGPLYVDTTIPQMEDIEKKFSSDFNGWVNKGGHWKPTECKARKKLALIIPYRNRYEQLKVFLRQMHPILKRQYLDYRIIVVEQGGDTIFNRALLFNIGFNESQKFDQFECFIFHDVDLIPEDDRNEYSCPTSPRHLSVAVDKFQYRLPYTTIFGGAGAFSREHFQLVNGFSNKFWGWGGEDDDLYNRISAKQLKLTRPSMQVGRYKMLKMFHTTGKEDPDRFNKLKDSAQRMATDGLNSLKYKVDKLTEHRLYTQITVDVREAMPK